MKGEDFCLPFIAISALSGDIDPEKVIFKNTTGTVFNAKRKGKTYEIDLVAAQWRAFNEV
jgi:hypothetical protein